MQSVDGVERLHMSGARAVIIPTSDFRPDEDGLAEAFAAKGMELVTYEKTTRPAFDGFVVIDAGVT